MRSIGYFIVTLTVCFTASAAAPQFSEIARYADGSIRLMNQPDAESYCKAQDMHLPSARELAQLSQSLGAFGIINSVPAVRVKGWELIKNNQAIYYRSNDV